MLPATRSAGELVADDPEGQREDAAAGALDDAPDDHRDQRRRQRRDHGADAEDAQRDQQQALLAVHVAEPADDRGRHRRRQQVAGQQPRHPGLGGVEAVLDRRQGRDHRRAQHRVGQAGHRGDGQDQVRD